MVSLSAAAHVLQRAVKMKCGAAAQQRDSQRVSRFQDESQVFLL
jgi:hypothetical protein